MPEIRKDEERFSRMTAKMAIGLAGPHTWVASIMPVLVACSLAYANIGTISVSLALVLLAICVLLQSAVNTLNDYFDFKKGADSVSDGLEETDAVLVYNRINPNSALLFAVGLIISAFILGIYPIVRSGWAPLAIALAGAIIVFLYSGGKTPISYMPIGEAVSGFTMGGLMCFACYTVLTGVLEPMVFLWSLPLMIGIALIMQSNNTCDIEKDIAAKRRTLPVLLGRRRSCMLYRALCIIWMTLIVVNTCIWFTGGSIILPFMALAVIPIMKGLLSNPLIPGSRIAAMSSICAANVALMAFYAACIFAGSIMLAV